MFGQVLDVFPVPGMVVKPSEGVLPSGGKAILELHFKPNSLFKFDIRIEVKRKKRIGETCLCFSHDDEMCVCDTQIDACENLCVLQIALKSMKTIELRVGGSVEPPVIDISVVSVCCNKHD